MPKTDRPRSHFPSPDRALRARGAPSSRRSSPSAVNAAPEVLASPRWHDGPAVNRATFYRHFEDLGDIQERGLGIALEEIAAPFVAAPSLGEPGWASAAEPRVVAFFEIVRTRGALFTTSSGNAVGSILAERAVGFLETFLFDARLATLDAAAMTLPPRLAARALASTLARLRRMAHRPPR